MFRNVCLVVLALCNVIAVVNSANDNSTKAVEKRTNPLLVFDDDSDGDCTTPDDKKGKCNTLQSCPGLYGVRDLSVLRKYICGYSGGTPLLCCPREFQATTPKPVHTAKPTQASHTDATSLRAVRPSLFPEECGNTNASLPRVVGGVDAKRGDWPWQVIILKRNEETQKNEPHCGGSLLSRRHVLSASHCFVLAPQKVTPASSFKIRLGEHDLSKPSDSAVERSVARLITHKDFEYGINTNDIAILVMDREVTFSRFVSPICLPYSKEIIPDNITERYVFVTGWGRTRYLGKTANVLQQASFPIWDSKRCTDVYKEVHIDHVDNRRFICAGDESGIQDSCQGDSGGPLVRPEGYSPTRFYQVGIVSFGVRCATKGFPGVYTRVTNYLEWINKNTQ